jgi:RNA polymerase sigma-70 factor (ECF subfamily)
VDEIIEADGARPLQDCIKRAQEGCEESFNWIVHEYSERLYYFLLKMGVNKHDAEDLSQETFIRAYNAIGSYNPEYQFSTWLFTIGRRLAISHFRAKKSHVSIEDHAEAGNISYNEEEPETGITIWQRAEKILTSREYQALWLRYEEGLPVKDVGKAMKISSLHMRVILYRARKKLGESLNKADVE